MRPLDSFIVGRRLGSTALLGEYGVERGTDDRISVMNLGEASDGEHFDVAYLVLSGTTTAARCPELLRGLVGLGFATVIAIPTPNASRVIALRELADVDKMQV